MWGGVQVWRWAKVAEELGESKNVAPLCNTLNNHLQLRTYVVGHALTPVDVALHAALTGPAAHNPLASLTHSFAAESTISCFLSALALFLSSRTLYSIFFSL